jgi:hypothetical protein
LDDEESREKQTGDQHEILGGVSEEHFKCEADHAGRVEISSAG